MISIAAQESLLLDVTRSQNIKEEKLSRGPLEEPCQHHMAIKKKKKKTQRERSIMPHILSGLVVSERVQICFFVREKCSLKLKKPGVDDGFSHSLIIRRQRRDKLFLWRCY